MVLLGLGAIIPMDVRNTRKVVERAQSMGMLPLGAIIPMDVRTRHGVVELVSNTVPSRLDVNSQMGAKRKQIQVAYVRPTTLPVITLLESTTITQQRFSILSMRRT